ncbi:TMhelix containing protein [Vibrio phage 1.007.O._10N.261.55.F9]|nr:TMhelix containing protein [Vibrio phage 1.007.O._10N.261.55.F9]
MDRVGNMLTIVSGLLVGSIELIAGGNVSHIIWPFLAAAWAAMEMIK